ncbi:aldo/keto reductase [Pseudohongiella sp. O18]|uniref:aldo/keto reductase n=1 Tax=Pseudohongiella sp. O18 TaxID=2904248 RepID=UPI001F3A87CC|nr:aldo/keto reductase [Pseudohongiella sp. O18]
MNEVLMIPKRTLGSTGIDVSCLGLGTVKLGRNQGVKYPSSFELPDDRHILNLLATATELGINLIDTAPAYGISEQRLGELLWDRQRWVICTKTGEEFVDGQSRFDFSATHTRASIHRSLKRLNTDYLDLVLVHSDGRDREIIEHSDCFETLARLKEAGNIRAFGLSGKTVEGGLLALQHSDVVMVTFNPDQQEERQVIQQACKLNKGVLIKKAFASGHAVVDSSADPVRSNLQFSLQEPGVSAVVVGTINPHHLRDNVRACLD